MDNTRQFFWLLVLIGVLALLGTIVAHPLLGIGSAGFGTKKLTALIVGAALLLVGLWGTLVRPAGVRANRF